MKIIMQNRPTAFSMPGGDTIQMLKTKEFLEKNGVTVDIVLEKDPDVQGYDLVHVFNMQDTAVKHSYLQILNAKKQKKPVALSTIYWNFSEVNSWKDRIDKESSVRKRNWSIKEKIKLFLERTVGLKIIKLSTFEDLLLSGGKETTSELIKCHQLSCLLMADVLLPNARAELEIVIKDFGIPITNARIIPNGVDLSFQNSDGTGFQKRYGVGNFVLCVGRIEYIKNQHLLVRALKGCGIPLVLIGKAEANDYLKLCMSESDEKVYYLGQMAHEELGSAYAAAKVHALPSWRETPGLASLEAGLAGCNLVITNRGSTEEYFGDYAFYCEPDDVLSIRNAVMKAFNAARTDGLVKHITKNYTWEKAAEKTLEAYRLVLGMERYRQ